MLPRYPRLCRTAHRIPSSDRQESALRWIGAIDATLPPGGEYYQQGPPQGYPQYPQQPQQYAPQGGPPGPQYAPQQDNNKGKSGGGQGCLGAW
ncbi:hypothetical protein N7481_000100 [Penicillium waksmanii]|uniref:uncharacterized protein n=1 Tax=Penicillium waksmanii TaxID=69791 RepID=UPI0025474FE4|nr:uncharacterized protein N7481_000100 [Penicillium waksmanii]KAJ5999691.1 hypothetical protein N7481_000100 [Penicillium waksmanii]